MEIETAALLQQIEELGDKLLRAATGDDLGQVVSVAKSDINDNACQRGYLLGLESALRAEGIPAFLTSEEQIGLIQRRLKVIAFQLKAGVYNPKVQPTKEEAHAQQA